MKSLKEYALNISEKDYHELPSWSYSLIARYAREGFGVLPILRNQIAPNDAMEFGSLFDAMITRPSEVTQMYVVSDVVAPDAEKKVFDLLLSKGIKRPFANLSETELKEAIAEADYQRRWGYDAQYKHLADASEYYDVRRSGKKVVSTADWMDAHDMRNAFLGNEAVMNLLNSGDEVLYQAQFEKELVIPSSGGKVYFRKVRVKAMFDVLVVNHKDKTIQPIDIKTSSFAGYDFANSFVKMRYDLQAELYSYLLEEVIGDTEEYKDYTILPFVFACISRVDKVPVTYMYDPSEKLSFKDYTYKGWLDLLDEILEYQESEAKAPLYISLDKPNDLRALLNRDKWQKDI